MVHQSPPIWRIVTGFVIAPIFAAALMAVSERYQHGLNQVLEHLWGDTLLILIVGAYPAAVVFGIPAYALLRRRVAPRLLWCVLTGAVIAAMPWLLLTVFGPNPWQAGLGGIPTVIDGVKTSYGWLMSGKLLLQAAALGGVGGIVFWLIAAPRR